MLDAEQREVAAEAEEAFSSFLRKEINPGTAERDKGGTPFDREMLTRTAELGLLNYSIPEDVGGRGADATRWGLMLEQVGYYCEDGSLPLVLSLYAAVANALYQSGSPDIIERYVKPMARGKLLGAFAYSDGADPFAFSSSAVFDGDEWVLHGEKLMVTGGALADVFMTYLRGPQDDLMVFLIDREQPGVSTSPIEVAGLRAAGLSKLQLQGVRVPAAQVLVDNDGLSHAQSFLNDRRSLLTCGPLGRMRGIFEEIVSSLQETVRYGQPLSELQNVQASLGRMYVKIETSRAIMYRALHSMRSPDRDTMFDPLTSVSKYHVIENAVQLALQAMRLAGGYGYLKEHKYERYLRDFYGGVAGGGAQDILEVNLGVWGISDVENKQRRRQGEE